MLKQKIEEALKEHFQIKYLEVIDDSHRHAGHAEAKKSGGGHFEIIVVTSDFTGKPLLERHRMIYQSLKALKEQIHALKIQAKTPEEFQR